MRYFNSRSDGRSFDEAMIEAVWQKGDQKLMSTSAKMSAARACSGHIMVGKNSGVGRLIISFRFPKEGQTI